VIDLRATHKTVFIVADGIAAERRFHLLADKAEAFAARIIAQGGRARIAPYSPDDALASMLKTVFRDRSHKA
jgi:hypothetical protein